ncbi:MAG: hypothetical protein IJM92_06790 [Fibrobacter sp.]|uniref:hypothetical protein n=1 Tax=Fibrobacter sp. TaxID=35828 RepID=UPI0025BE8F36|nr:hypothetical protein [Fibrobacter sp.]MBQ7079360.1 hypothetical protein [Fibrobacter sp.]
MEKSQKINLAIFLAFIVFTIPLSYIMGSDFMGKQEKPWHMQGAVHEDSLSQEYLHKYKILDKVPVTLQVERSKEKRVLILIDAWGVPFDEQKLAKEFAIFKDVPHEYAIHKRLKNVTAHAEKVEFRTDSLDSLIVVDMLERIEPLLMIPGYKTMALTIHGSKYGSEEILQNILKEIAKLIKKFPDVQFIVQGAHRPILGTPKTRRQYYAHWVPVVIGNF